LVAITDDDEVHFAAGLVAPVVEGQVGEKGLQMFKDQMFPEETAVVRPKRIPSARVTDEAGVKGYEVISWNGVGAPKDTPKEIIDTMNKAITEVMAMPDVQKLLELEGGTASPSTPEEFQTFQREEVARWDKMVKQTGITID
jgi:tripartite-type tricarboxylate transporter receptor subunit TctC